MNKEKATKRLVPFFLVAALILVIAGTTFWSRTKSNKTTAIKIGIVTDLSGPAAYWGESCRVGAELAERELEADGYNVDLVFEDYQLDAAKALTSAQKLVNADNVDALYAEFNPAAISIGSFIKDKNKLFVYDAAVTSPLAGNDKAFKTYLDYQKGGHEIAAKFKSNGVAKMGVLKVNLEAGELFLKGVREVYGDDTIVESFDLGATDLKTQTLKLKNAGAGAVTSANFEIDTLNTLKAITELNYNVPFGTVDDSITENVKTKYASSLKGSYAFGFPTVDSSFSAKLKRSSGQTLATEYGAAITYTHIKQLVKAMSKANKNVEKASEIMAASPADSTIGFNGFNNHIADLDMNIKSY